MGKYIRTMAESLSMVHEVTNMDLMRKAAGGAMQTLKMKDGKVQMDSFTASAIMQIYDKVNDKNKKTMENMLKTGRRADIMKLQKFAMSKINAEYVPEELDEQLEEKIDPADVDDDATEDDIKSADKNIMMQMRKVQSLRGRYAVEFMDGKKVKVDPKIAMAVQDKYMKMRRPAEKEMFQSKVARSYKDMLAALKESLEEARQEVRQFKDPKKEMMIKSKDSGVFVIDKKDFKKYQKKGFFQVESVDLDELSIADVRKGTAKAKKRQGRERRTTGKTSTSTADLAARIKAKEEVELDEGMKYTHVAVDKKGLVIGFASDEKDAKDMARRNDGKVVKLKKPMSDKKGDMMVNRPFKEEVELDEGTFKDIITMKKGNVGVGVIANAANVKKMEKTVGK